MQQCIRIFIIPYLYEAQHVPGDTPPIIRSLKLHRQPLVFHTGTVCAWQRLPTTRPTTFHVWKTRGCQCSFRLLMMMGGVLPETRWASYKYGIIKFWYSAASCCVFIYGLYYDARIYENQIWSINSVFIWNPVDPDRRPAQQQHSWYYHTLRNKTDKELF